MTEHVSDDWLPENFTGVSDLWNCLGFISHTMEHMCLSTASRVLIFFCSFCPINMISNQCNERVRCSMGHLSDADPFRLYMTGELTALRQTDKLNCSFVHYMYFFQYKLSILNKWQWFLIPFSNWKGKNTFTKLMATSHTLGAMKSWTKQLLSGLQVR